MDKRELTLNIKAIMMFEKMAGVSYFDISEENYVFLIYSMYMVKHPYTYMTLLDFTKIFGDNQKVTKQLLQEFEECMNYLNQFINTSKKMEQDNSVETKEERNTQTITDIVAYLITNCGIDAHYAMYEMELWEIEALMRQAEKNRKEELETDRLWTFLNVLPHIDSKKCKTPDKLMPFPWEAEEKKNRQLKEIENNKFAFKNMIGKNIFGETEEEVGNEQG